MRRYLYLKGLSDREIIASRKEHGANLITKKKGRSFLRRLTANFGDPIIKILLIALAINIIFLFNTADWIETAGIAAAVILAVLISTLSEQGAQTAFRKLQEDSLKIRCRAIRAGGMSEIAVDEVVVGDLISLQSGDRIPADGIVVNGRAELDQSAINGETKEARKAAGDTVLSGSVVMAGEGVMRVTLVGDATVYGQIAGEVQEDAPTSPLKERLSRLAGTVSIFGYCGAALAALAYLFNVLVLDNGFDTGLILAAVKDRAFMIEKLLHAATLAVTVIVVAVPEGRV
jgi:magnesium-transporting ATPase (P-type)